MAGVDPAWSHSMAHALALDTRTWLRGDVPGFALTALDTGFSIDSNAVMANHKKLSPKAWREMSQNRPIYKSTSTMAARKRSHCHT